MLSEEAPFTLLLSSDNDMVKHKINLARTLLCNLFMLFVLLLTCIFFHSDFYYNFFYQKVKEMIPMRIGGGENQENFDF